MNKVITGLLVALAVAFGSLGLASPASAYPDTPPSNSDPSLPISYLAFATRTGIPFDYGTPAVVTTNLTARVPCG